MRGVPLRTDVLQRISAIPTTEWNALAGDDYPFLRHAFLAALEHSGSVGRGTGWDPCFVVLRDEAGLAAAAPGWLKAHSYGEFVFDFSWAQAYSRSGRAYYPKLVVAVPFTPTTGPRLLVRPDLDRGLVVPQLLDALAALADQNGQISSVHVLFPHAAGPGGLAGPRLADAPRLPVPLEQCRLW